MESNMDRNHRVIVAYVDDKRATLPKLFELVNQHHRPIQTQLQPQRGRKGSITCSNNRTKQLKCQYTMCTTLTKMTQSSTLILTGRIDEHEHNQ